MDEQSEELLRQLEALAASLSPEDRLELVEHLSRSPHEQGPLELDRAEEEQLLRDSHERLSTPHEFSPGNLVEWKKALRNRQLPDYGQAAVVLEVLDAPLLNETEPPDSPYYREPLDLILGVVDGDGDLAAIHFDRRRFQPLTSRHFKI